MSVPQHQEVMDNTDQHDHVLSEPSIAQPPRSDSISLTVPAKAYCRSSVSEIPVPYLSSTEGAAEVSLESCSTTSEVQSWASRPPSQSMSIASDNIGNELSTYPSAPPVSSQPRASMILYRIADISPRPGSLINEQYPESMFNSPRSHPRPSFISTSSRDSSFTFTNDSKYDPELAGSRYSAGYSGPELERVLVAYPYEPSIGSDSDSTWSMSTQQSRLSAREVANIVKMGLGILVILALFIVLPVVLMQKAPGQ
ncbi:hypothetical protein BDP27DRAFT_1037892 [Rhodocollybia butyracea]|uniref:Uncharacterized protein n=1 Tax=Rhodocollybia butyracea TaxID=206335 RepID=A0A9P5UDT2_9AGAR|nr:hypothetical protein BDP27DRAFT_1037892 [Rhodocollybia butyracea]